MDQDYRNGNVQQDEAEFRISVIVPCYNVQQYIRRCLDSLLQQTIGFSSIQLILVDDASTDHTLEILREYERQYPDNILLIPLEQNVGQGVARNIALEYVQADYIGFVDADDWIELDMYEIMYRTSCLYHCEVIKCGIDRRRVWTVTEPQKGRDISVTVYDLENQAEQEKYIYDHREDILCVNKLFSKHFLQENEIRFAEGIKYEDHYFGMLVLLYCSKIARVDRVLYHWYENTQSTCMSGKYVMDRIAVQQFLYEECRRRDFLLKYRELLEYNLYEKMVVETVYYLRRQGEDISPILAQLMQLMQQLGIDIRKNRYYLQEINGEK